MIQKNPKRADFYKKYLKIIQEYNEGKDAEAVRKAFEDLIKFVNDLNDEENRTIRENLDEETLAIFDLLCLIFSINIDPMHTISARYIGYE